ATASPKLSGRRQQSIFYQRVECLLELLWRYRRFCFIRARAEPYSDLTKYYNDMVKYAESKDRDSALKSADDMRKALGAVFGFSQDAPSRLTDGNLRDLAGRAQTFVDATKDLSGRLQNLQEKLKRTGEDYSSELSSLKDSYGNFKEKFNIIYENRNVLAKCLKPLA